MFRILDQWLGILFTGVAFCLALEFMLRIFAPGNAETAWLFQTIHPIQPLLETGSYYLTQPVDKIGSLIQTYAPWLTHWIPHSIQTHFPVMPAHVVGKWLAQWLLIIPHDPHSRYAQDIIGARYQLLFPGAVDWRLMVALPLWGWAESLASGVLQGMETLWYRNSLRRQDKAVVRQLQTEWDPQNPKEQHAS